jgi:hypothetical protein
MALCWNIINANNILSFSVTMVPFEDAFCRFLQLPVL